MTEPALVDNDVVLKLCCFNCHPALATAIGNPPVAMLGIGRFTLRDRIRRTSTIVHRERVAAALEQTIACLRLVQPDDDELKLATELEEQAARLSLDLDTGESQLLAILLHRKNPFLLTGDKRAIVAVHVLGVRDLNGRMGCLEQVLATMVAIYGLTFLRGAICAEPHVDRAATVCFACTSDEVDEEEVRIGLSSYIEHLRRASGKLLVGSGDLSAVLSGSSAGTPRRDAEGPPPDLSAEP